MAEICKWLLQRVAMQKDCIMRCVLDKLSAATYPSDKLHSMHMGTMECETNQEINSSAPSAPMLRCKNISEH